MEISPLPVKGCKFWSMLWTHDHWVSKLTLEKGCCPAFEQNLFSSSKDTLWPVCLKLARWFWRRECFNFINIFFVFSNYLPPEKGVAVHWNKFLLSSPKDALCQVWLKVVKWFWRRRWKCGKFTTTKDNVYISIRKGKKNLIA